jgi:hypothetical protein
MTNNKKQKIKKTTLFLISLVVVYGCMGNQQSINNKTNKEQITDEPYRDRTPNAPRPNVPAHTF